MSSNGTYIKTACFMRYECHSHIVAFETCVKLGMKFYAIDSKEVLMGTAKILHAHHGQGAVIWVDGRKDRNGKWFNYNSGKKIPIYKNITWKTSSKTGKNRHCLRVATVGSGLLEFDGLPCPYQITYMCEFSKLE